MKSFLTILLLPSICFAAVVVEISRRTENPVVFSEPRQQLKRFSPQRSLQWIDFTANFLGNVNNHRVLKSDSINEAGEEEPKSGKNSKSSDNNPSGLSGSSFTSGNTPPPSPPIVTHQPTFKPTKRWLIGKLSTVDKQHSSNHGNSDDATIYIVVGCILVVVLLIAYVLYYFLKKDRS